MIPAITCVALDMTTHCDRRCPECCAGVGINRALHHHPWEYFETAAKPLYGVERVHLSGGEPTLHPQFAEFVSKFKELFGCKRLSMVTDGWGVVKHEMVIARHIDEVHFTRYGTRPAAEKVLRYLESFHGIELLIFDAGEGMSNFTPRSQIGGGKPCYRSYLFSGQIAYADGRIYGCCVAPGIDGAKSIVPVRNIAYMFGAHPIEEEDPPNPPCEKCWWSLNE